MITPDELERKCKEFKEIEGRASFYDLAMEIKGSYPLQAAVIILATWNAGRFRFMINDPHSLIDLKNALKDCEPTFEELRDEEFRTTNFNDLKESVESVFNAIQSGGSKVHGGIQDLPPILPKTHRHVG